MNLSQKQQVLEAIHSFEAVDFETAFAQKYKDTATMESVQAGDYSVADLLALGKKAVRQLNERLQNDDWQVLPFVQNLNEYVIANLYIHIINIRKNLQAGAYPPAANQIKALVYYEIHNGFWNQPQKIELGIRESSLAKLEQRAALMMAHIEERQSKINQLIDDVNSLKEGLDEFRNEKKQEFQTIRRNQEESGRLLADIKKQEALAAAGQNNIVKVTEQCDNVLKKLQEERDAAKKQQAEISKQNEEIQTANQQLKEEINTDLTKIQETYNTTTKYKEDIAKMMGFIADGTLAHSFRAQYDNKTTAIKGWGWCVGLSLIVLVGWIYVVFNYLSATTEYEWINLIINGIKSSPIAFFFGFALNQFSKAYNVREEYAYREAVALTLTAYMEQLEGEENLDKKQLLLNTVEKLYTKPILSSNESKSPIKINTKDFTDIMAQLTEAVKAIKQ